MRKCATKVGSYYVLAAKYGENFQNEKLNEDALLLHTTVVHSLLSLGA